MGRLGGGYPPVIPPPMPSPPYPKSRRLLGCDCGKSEAAWRQAAAYEAQQRLRWERARESRRRRRRRELQRRLFTFALEVACMAIGGAMLREWWT